MAERNWLDPSGFVYVSLGEGGGGAAGSSCPPPNSAGLPCARRAGSPGTAIVRLHKCPSVCITPPSVSACLSLLTRQVWPGGGGARVGSRIPGSEGSPTLFPMVLSTPLLLHQCAHPHCPVSHLHSSGKRLLSAFVCSVMSFCVMFLALALAFPFGRLLLSLLPLSCLWKLIKEAEPG